MRAQQDIVTDSPDVELDAPAHVRGVHEGNDPHPLFGGERVGRAHLQGARRATGINAKDREPIDPSMPRLSPA